MGDMFVNGAGEALRRRHVRAPGLAARRTEGREAVLSEIDATQDAREHREALSALVVEMTNEGLDYYFTGSLVSAKVSFIVQQSSNLGIAGVKQVMAPVIKKVIARLDHEQIVSISASIRTLMA